MFLQLEKISLDKLYEIIGWLDLAEGPLSDKERYQKEIQRRKGEENALSEKQK